MKERSEAYVAAWDERYAPIPWAERYREPTPPIPDRWIDTPAQTAKRRQILANIDAKAATR